MKYHSDDALSNDGRLVDATSIEKVVHNFKAAALVPQCRFTILVAVCFEEKLNFIVRISSVNFC
jgi:hypothetical protein